MISFQIIVSIVILHFIADFLCQSQKMGETKSEDFSMIILHSAIYSLPFIFISPLYAFINGILHGGVDNVTSKWTKKLYNKKEYHWFFVVIGFDQMVHMLTLFATYIILF